jgi:hypothetical protein
MTRPEGYSELFILSPAHAGTTAMAKLLLQSPRIWSSMPNAEGQKLPQAQSLMPEQPWKQQARLDWTAVKAVWEQGRPEGSILLEKSPPNLMRPDQMLAVWPNAFYVISMRNPYALLGSYLTRREITPELIAGSIAGWLKRSRVQRANVVRLKGRSIVTSYEAFTTSPGGFVRSLEAVFGDLGVDPDRPLQVKYYETAPIENHNERQISTLSPAQLDLARDLLMRDGAEDLAYWGY